MRTSLVGAGIGIALLAGACQPPTNGDGDGNTLRLVLGADGVFNVGIDPVTRTIIRDVRADLPTADRVAATLSLVVDDVTVEVAGDDPSAAISVLAFWSPDTEDPCAFSPQFNQFNITVNSTGVVAVAPESVPLNDAQFDLVNAGTFGLCLVATADQDVTLTMQALTVNFTAPGPVAAARCSDVLALPEVQAALATLNANGIPFRVPLGTFEEDLLGTYALSQATTFDPDGADIGDNQSGTVTLAVQQVGAITRRGFDSELPLFVEGNANSVGFCALAQTFDPQCDQTIARLENLARDPTTGNLDGRFLAVAVRRHRFTVPTCGARGDFILGDLSLTAGATPDFLARRGKVPLPADFRPDLLALPAPPGNGIVTAADALTALRFSLSTPFATTELALPAEVTGTRVGGLGIATDQSRYALAIANPPRVATFDLTDDTLIRLTEIEDPISLEYLGGLLDLSADATEVYVPGTDDRFADRVNFVRTDQSPFADVDRRLQTPAGARPTQVRLSPDGNQLAVLLESGAPAGLAAGLTFINLTTGGLLVPPLDLFATTGGTVLADELVYSADGSRVFLAGLGAVVVVETAGEFNVSTVDVSGVSDVSGVGDDPVALALSGDGRVLAVALDDATGNADFAVMDADTLAVLNTQDLPGIGNRRALDLVHFSGQRVAVVANTTSTIVAVQTEAPFAAGEPVLVADVTDANTLGRLATAGDLLAVTNLDEPAIYILESTTP
jgi:hypothetical protein